MEMIDLAVYPVHIQRRRDRELKHQQSIIFRRSLVIYLEAEYYQNQSVNATFKKHMLYS